MADRYWVGGSGTWNTTSTTNWSATSGGTGGASAPTSADRALLNAASGTVTVTLGENISLLRLDTTGFTGTLDFSTYKFTVVGSNTTVFTGVTTATYSGSKNIEFTYSGGTGTRVISCATVTEANACNITVTTATDAVTLTGGMNNVTLTNFSGTLNTTATRTVYGNYTLGSGMTLAASSSAMQFFKSSGTQEITSAGKTQTTSCTIGTSSPASTATFKFMDNFTVDPTKTVTYNSGTLDTNNNNFSTGLFVTNSSLARTLIFGTGTFNLTGNAGTIYNQTTTNLTLSGTPNIYATYSGSTGTRTIRGGSLGTGTNQTNSVNLFVNAGTDTVDLNFGFRDVTLTGFSGTLARSLGSLSVFNNLVIPSGITTTASIYSLSFLAPTAGSITTGGVTLNSDIVFGSNSVAAAVYTCQDALTQGTGYTVTLYSNLKLKAGVTSTVGGFSSLGLVQMSLSSTLAGSQATLSDASGTVAVSLLTITDINATGGATWNAYTTYGNSDGGNNSGWDFSAPLRKYIYTRRKDKRILP